LNFDINNIFGSATNFCLRYALAKLEKLTFCSAYFYFGTAAILKFDSFSILPYWTYMNCKGDSLFFSYCTIGISMYQKWYFTIHYSLLIYPKLIPFWSITDKLTYNSSPLVPSIISPPPLSVWGPTCRHNSNGLAELWGGWPIELESPYKGAVGSAIGVKLACVIWY
jgi:hypothetical protein